MNSDGTLRQKSRGKKTNGPSLTCEVLRTGGKSKCPNGGSGTIPGTFGAGYQM